MYIVMVCITLGHSVILVFSAKVSCFAPCLGMSWHAMQARSCRAPTKIRSGPKDAARISWVPHIDFSGPTKYDGLAIEGWSEKSDACGHPLFVFMKPAWSKGW